jgi:hypothetical protein
MKHLNQQVRLRGRRCWLWTTYNDAHLPIMLIRILNALSNCMGSGGSSWGRSSSSDLFDPIRINACIPAPGRHRTPWQIPYPVTDKSNLALKIRGIRKGDSRLAVSRNRHDCTRHIRDLPCTKYMNISYTPVSAAWWINAVINRIASEHILCLPWHSQIFVLILRSGFFRPSPRSHKTIRGLCKTTISYI